MRKKSYFPFARLKKRDLFTNLDIAKNPSELSNLITFKASPSDCSFPDFLFEEIQD